MDAQLDQARDFGDWVLSLQELNSHGLVAGGSNGVLKLYEFGLASEVSSTQAHNGSVNRLRAVDEHVVASCGNDGLVKLWDMRTTKAVGVMTNPKNVPFLSLDVGHGLIAAGSELKNQDAGLYIWDLKKLDSPWKSLVDSHHDDITEIRFHPTQRDLLLSGSTDGYVNIYDLKQQDEEDAQLQLINFESIHSANFLSPTRIYTLSHMETFALHQLVDLTTEESIEPQPTVFGDIREKWGCEYVVDIYAPGYICCGSNTEGLLKLYQFDPTKENFDQLGAAISFPRAHGDEVVRDLVIHNGLVYTGGEDGTVKCWKAPLKDTCHQFFATSEPLDEPMDAEPEVKHKHKHKHKDKDHKEHSHKHKHKHGTKFKPY